MSSKESKVHFKYRTSVHTLCGMTIPKNDVMFSDSIYDITCKNCLRRKYAYYMRDECKICGPNRWFGLIDFEKEICYCRNCGVLQVKRNPEVN